MLVEICQLFPHFCMNTELESDEGTIETVSRSVLDDEKKSTDEDDEVEEMIQEAKDQTQGR